MSAHAVFYRKIRTKTFFFYGLSMICLFVVGANIIYSQKYNKHMYGVMEGGSESTLIYLKHIWGTPLYNLEIETYQTEGKNDILSKWTEIQQNNKKRIQNLEEATLLHPYSPELYYNLHLLYLENGDKIKADSNLKRAQQINPSLE